MGIVLIFSLIIQERHGIVTACAAAAAVVVSQQQNIAAEYCSCCFHYDNLCNIDKQQAS